MSLFLTTEVAYRGLSPEFRRLGDVFFVPVDRPLLFRSHAKLVCLIATIYSEVDSDVDVMSMIYPESAIIR